MRLINTRTLRLESFGDTEAPRYAILSHRWQQEEIEFLDIGSKNAQKRKGYTKFVTFCNTAFQDGFDYAWMDTCCIDKRWSSEESEAINSMYLWYRNAGRCYAYLFDVAQGGVEFGESVWFSRGWTLQELIAPRKMYFYDSRWQFLGSKKSLLRELILATGIDSRVLEGANPNVCSIAQRMSWAANRTTERIEDRAYSLVGLFDISLTANYGEREESFIRLQKEIIKESDDESIFAWNQGTSYNMAGCMFSGLLASDPTAFADCQNVVRTEADGINLEGYGIGQQGLTLSLWTKMWSMNQYVAVLDCRNKSLQNSRFGIILQKLDAQQQYARVLSKDHSRITVGSYWPKYAESFGYRKLRVSVRQKISNPPLIPQLYGFRFDSLDLPGYSQDRLQRLHIWSRSTSTLTKEDSRLVLIEPELTGTAGVVYSSDPDLPWYAIRSMRVGFDYDTNPVLLLCTDGPERSTSIVMKPNPNRHCLLGFDHHKISCRLLKYPAFSEAWLNGRLHSKYVVEWSSKRSESSCRSSSDRDTFLRPFLSGPCVFVITGDEDGMVEEIPCLNVRIRILRKQLPNPRNVQGGTEKASPLVWTISVTRSDGHVHPETLLARKRQRQRMTIAKDAAGTTGKVLAFAPLAAILGLEGFRGIKNAMGS